MDIQAAPQDRRREGEGPSGTIVCWKRFSDWSKEIMVMISGIALTYYCLREEIAEHAISLYVMACRSFIFFAFLANLVLMLIPTFLLSHRRMNECLYVTAKILIFITGVLMMLISASLLLLLNPKYGKLVIIVLGMQLVILFCYYKGINTARKVTDYEAHQSELKLFFNISASVTVAAFGGMMVTIYGYFKKFSKDVNQVSIRISEVGIFFTVTLGLLEMLLTTVPPPLPHRNARSRFLNLIIVHTYYLLGWLVLTLQSVCAEFVGKLVFWIIFAAVVVAVSVAVSVAVVILSTHFDQVYSAKGHQSLPDTFWTNITSFIFAALVAVCSVYIRSKEDDFRLHTCMFFMSFAFMFGLQWMALLFRRLRVPDLTQLALDMRNLARTVILNKKKWECVGYIS